MSTTTIFFDFDGPIVDNRYKYHALHCDVLAELGSNSCSELHAYWEAKRARMSEWEILRKLGAERLFEKYERLRLERIEDAHYARLDRAWPGIDVHLAELGRKFEICLLTLRKRRSELLAELAGLGLEQSFSKILSEDDNTGTADVKVRLARAVTLGREEQCCFVGDTELDIEAGKALGIATIGVGAGIRSYEDLRASQPDLMIERALDLTEPMVRWLLEQKRGRDDIQSPAVAASNL